MTYYSFEGSTDYLAAQPALIATFKASGSITAGRGLAFDAGGTSQVYTPTAIASGSLSCAGLSIESASTGNPVSALVWGFAKNLPAVSGWTPATGDLFQLSGSAQFTSLTTGSQGSVAAACAGKVISGSGAGGNFIAFLDCMK